MPQSDVDRILSEGERREIFRALVEAQDRPMTVAESRMAICEQFGLSEGRVRQIEREGLDGNWPPL